MKFITLAAALVALAMAAGAAEDPDFSSIETLDIENLLKDENKKNIAFACVMDRGPCGEMQTLRDALPVMIETKCSQCTPKQKEKFDQIAKILFENHNKEFQELVAKYSPKSE